MNLLATDRADQAGPVSRLAHGYDEEGQVNLAGYAGSLTVFGAAALAVSAVAQKRGSGGLRVSLRDIAVGALATHTLSRLLAKGAVTSPIRAPFTEFEHPTGASQHQAKPRGSGVRHTIGELLTCPFCMSQWTAGTYLAGLLLAPTVTRRWAALFAVAGSSDLLHHAHERLRSA